MNELLLKYQHYTQTRMELFKCQSELLDMLKINKLDRERFNLINAPIVFHNFINSSESDLLSVTKEFNICLNHMGLSVYLKNTEV